jgi:hypothetical protein
LYYASRRTRIVFVSMTRSHRRSAPVGSRRPFTVEEDAALVDLVGPTPVRPWDQIAADMPGRSARQCRERWICYLSPSIRMGPWTLAEDQHLLYEIARFGHQWTIIADHFHGRSGNDVKNRWYSHLQSAAVPGPNGGFQLVRCVGGTASGQKKARNRRVMLPNEGMPVIPPAALLFGDAKLELPPLLPRRSRESEAVSKIS